MTLPPWAPWWIGVLGAVFAIPLAKQAFGGLGQNLFNPAMVARVALLVSFPVAMTAWTPPAPLFSESAPSLSSAMTITFGGQAPDGVSAATALGYVKTELSRGIPVHESLETLGRRDSAAVYTPDLMDLATGYKPGSLGETSAVLILLGGLFLIRRRIITWHIPVAVLGTLFVMGSVFNALDPARFAPGFFQMISGATFLGAFFIATDYVTSPVTHKGQLVFGFGVGLSDLGHPYLCRLPGGYGVRGPADELAYTHHRSIHASADVRSDAQGRSLTGGAGIMKAEHLDPWPHPGSILFGVWDSCWR